MRLPTILGLALLLLLTVSTSEAAAGTVRACAARHLTGAGGATITLEIHVGANCADTTTYIKNAGECWPIKGVWADSSGLNAPTGWMIAIYPDANTMDHGTGGTNFGTALYRASFTTEAAFEAGTTFCATDTGLAQGSPRAGTYRLVARACRYSSPDTTGCAGTAVTYDFNTDRDPSGGTPNGIVPAGYGDDASTTSPKMGGLISRANIFTVTDSTTNGGPDESLYVVGDVPWFMVTGTPSNLGARSYRIATLEPGTTTTINAGFFSLDAGSGSVSIPAVAHWNYVDHNGTGHKAQIGLFQKSSLLGEEWTRLNDVPSTWTKTGELFAEGPWGVPDVGLRLACPRTEHPTNSAQDATALERGEAFKCRGGDVRNARGQLVTSRAFRVYLRPASGTFGTTVEAPSCDGFTTSTGTWICDMTLSASATPAVDYLVDMRTYTDTSRTSMHGDGSVRTQTDVSDQLTLQGIHAWLQACDQGPEQAVYVIAAETICLRTGPVTNARGELVTRSLTFTTTYTENASGTTLPPRTTSGVTTGTEPPYLLSPQPPASTEWSFKAVVTDANGNRGEKWRMFTFISPYTSIMKIACLGTDIPTPPGASFNVTCQTLKRNPSTFILEPSCPDATPYYRIDTSTDEGEWFTAVPTSHPVANAREPCTYWANWTVPMDHDVRTPAVLLISANISGTSINEAYPLQVQEETGNDPLHATATWSWDTRKALITATASYANGTRRSGIADLISAVIYGPRDEELPLGAVVLEEREPGIYVTSLDLGLSPLRGAYVVAIDAPQPRSATARASAAASFLIEENMTLLMLDQRELTSDLFAALNATRTEILERISGLSDVVNQTRETLTNATDRLEEKANLTHDDLRAHANLTLENFERTWDMLANATRPREAQLGIESWGHDGAQAYVGKPVRLQGKAAMANGTWGPLFWAWDLGDNTTAWGPLVYKTYEKPGNYTVTATASDSLGNANATTLTFSVNLSRPVLNVTGPKVVHVGEHVTFSIGTSHDPHDEVVYTFIVDPYRIDLPYVGERWVHKGYCGPLNMTTFEGPTFEGVSLGPVSFGWINAKRETCETMHASFWIPGTHEVWLYGVNSHGVEEKFLYEVQVQKVGDSLRNPGPPDASQLDYRPAAREALDRMNKVIRFLQWLLT